jgi:hypothetical protein
MPTCAQNPRGLDILSVLAATPPIMETNTNSSNVASEERCSSKRKFDDVAETCNEPAIYRGCTMPSTTGSTQVTALVNKIDSKTQENNTLKVEMNLLIAERYSLLVKLAQEQQKVEHLEKQMNGIKDIISNNFRYSAVNLSDVSKPHVSPKQTEITVNQAIHPLVLSSPARKLLTPPSPSRSMFKQIPSTPLLSRSPASIE